MVIHRLKNASDLAVALVSNGITEITDNIRKKLHYLHQICKEVVFDN